MAKIQFHIEVTPEANSRSVSQEISCLLWNPDPY
jgi:hypothetical protein